jgi:hypothetical protein
MKILSYNNIIIESLKHKYEMKMNQIYQHKVKITCEMS